jgi:hypothetical protein
MLLKQYYDSLMDVAKCFYKEQNLPQEINKQLAQQLANIK